MRPTTFLTIFICIAILGCATAPIEDEAKPETNQQITEPIPEVIVEDVAEDEPIEEVLTPVACDMDIDPLTLNHISLSFEEEGVKRSADGIEFSFYPKDASGNIIPVEGNLQVLLYWTEIFNDQRRSKSIVYGYNKYIKPADVAEDCSPKPIFIAFSDMEADGRFNVKEGDPGFLKVIFKRSGSDTEYSAQYMPKEGENFFP